MCLPLAVKNITGSTKVVTLLNRYGHGLSASQVQEAEASMARDLLEQGGPGADAFVPSSIKPCSFVQVCWDNNDVLEETLTGTGTTHCTNGIAVQRQTHLAKCKPLSNVRPYPADRVHCRTTPQNPFHEMVSGWLMRWLYFQVFLWPRIHLTKWQSRSFPFAPDLVQMVFSV